MCVVTAWWNTQLSTSPWLVVLLKGAEVKINHSNQKHPLSSNHVLGGEVIFQRDKLKLWEKAPMIAKVAGQLRRLAGLDCAELPVQGC